MSVCAHVHMPVFLLSCLLICLTIGCLFIQVSVCLCDVTTVPHIRSYCNCSELWMVPYMQTQQYVCLCVCLPILLSAWPSFYLTIHVHLSLCSSLLVFLWLTGMFPSSLETTGNFKSNGQLSIESICSRNRPSLSAVRSVFQCTDLSLWSTICHSIEEPFCQFLTTCNESMSKRITDTLIQMEHQLLQPEENV